jgi:DNA-binding TFAR19-related protein (PDSD5 family)
MDEELERLKRRKMRELRRRMIQENAEAVEAEPPKEPTPREILDSRFKSRAWEVYRAAEAQFPAVMPQIERILVESIKQGKIRDRIDGESLFLFLRQVGLPVRLQTHIRYKEHGELKTIGQHLKEK